MAADYVFKNKDNVYFVVGSKKCFITKEPITEIGFVMLIKDRIVFLSLKGLKESKKYFTNQKEYFQFFVTDRPASDFVLVNFRSSTLSPGSNLYVYDVEDIDRKFPSKTVDKTRFAGRRSFEGVSIGIDVKPLLEDLDKPIGSDEEVELLLNKISSSEVLLPYEDKKFLGGVKYGL